MASVLQVATIKDQGGNANAIEIENSSANVTINNLAGGAIGSAVTGFTGVKNLDVWYVNAAINTTATIAANKFTRGTAGIGMANIGTGMTLATSGTDDAIFTFPVTGIWKVESLMMYSLNDDDRIQENMIQVSPSGTGGTFTTRAKGYSHISRSQSAHTYVNNYVFCHLDVTTSGNNSSSGFAIKFRSSGQNSAGIGYDASAFVSGVTFTRIGDT